MFNYPAGTIPVPSYLLDDEQLAALHEAAWQFAMAEDEDNGPPCPRAAATCRAIEAEIAKRGSPIRLRK